MTYFYLNKETLTAAIRLIEFTESDDELFQRLASVDGAIIENMTFNMNGPLIIKGFGVTIKNCTIKYTSKYHNKFKEEYNKWQEWQKRK